MLPELLDNCRLEALGCGIKRFRRQRKPLYATVLFLKYNPDSLRLDIWKDLKNFHDSTSGVEKFFKSYTMPRLFRQERRGSRTPWRTEKPNQGSFSTFIVRVLTASPQDSLIVNSYNEECKIVGLAIPKVVALNSREGCYCRI